ncbi:hypothetical protein VA7868_02966 [Vibrio aerogenes CECT 7868]|uniref:Uncharacterized protein n=1 Tax=Vibrio aerogenes CECT 7868 TaxID=1216006 RepID=A0A1M5ZN70_9VIBR|nr:hypothetical protein [Vibrio aerogenes]SHI25680.1 hypothetical protein VA7868_02966 [Vibrio aerogenes CECT 7868]
MLAFGSCTGMVTGLDDAIMDAVNAQLADLVEDPENYAYEDYSLTGVGIKAMNPGTGAKKQNYPKTNICDVPEPDPEV